MSDTLEVPDLTKDLSSAEGQTETSPRKEEKPVKEELTVPNLTQDLSKADSVKPQAQDLKVPDLKQDLKSQGIVSAEETPTDISDEFSAQLLKTGPFKTDVAEARQMFGALRPDQTQKVLEVHPWAYNYLTPEQKTDQYKFSSSQSPLTWKAARDAAVATGGFFGNLLKSGANVGLDAAYATVAAPIKDAINRGTWIAYSDKDRPQTVEAYKKLDQDMRDASGAIAQGVIDAKRGIERIHGGPLAASDFTEPSMARATAGFGFAPLFLATQIAELGKNPNSGSLAFVDHINQHLGLETPEEAQRHWDIRKTYDAHKGAEDWTASGGEPKTSPWSKALYSPVGQELMTLRERSKLPDAETYASAKGISVDQARQELNNAADQNADKATRDITLRWNREYQPEMETLGAMFLGPAGMGEAGTVIGATGLLKKAATAAETLGMSDEAANAYFAAQKARQAKKLADEINEAKKAGYAGKVAGSVENAQTRLAEAARAKFESLPPVVQKWGPVVLGKLGLAGVGGVAGEIVAPEDRTKGILGGVTLATGLGMAPGIVRSLSDASRVIGAGEGGVFEQAGKAGTSSKAAQVLFGGNRGKVADYIGNNLNTMLKSGVNMAALNAATSSFNSDDPKKFVESVGEGFGMGAAFPLLHKGAGVFHSIDPESEAVNRKKRDVEIYEAFNRADAPTQANLSKVNDYNNAIQRARNNQTAMQAHLEEAVKSGDQKKIDEATKAKNVADSLLKQVLRANVQTRNEYGRNFLSLYTDINSLANGARKAGQPRLQMQLRTKAEIMADLVKEAQASGQPINPADIEHQADQQGFYHKDGKFVVNLDRILARQSLFGESPTEALLHEGAGHGLFNIPEFRELNKKAENLLFDRYEKDLQGNIIDTKEGQYSDDELVDMYTNKYLGNEDDAGKLQFARTSGLLDEKGDLDRNKVVQYMKEEIIAELNAGNLRQGLGKLKNASPVENWINNNLKSSRLARAVQAVTGLGIKPFSSDVVGAKFGTDVVEANRRALKALADYNGNFSDQTEEEKGSDIPEKEMRANPSTARRYGLNGGEFQTQLVGVLKDANGNVIQKVPIANPNAAEGTWAHDPENNQVKQTRGYGQVPDEFQGVSVPKNGTLEVTRDFVYEPDGKTPVRTPDKKLAELEKSRGDLIRQALESADDRYGTVGLLPYSADGLSWKGIMSPKQIQAIKEIPESILPLSIKEKIFSFNEALARGEGDTFDLDYAARLGKGRKYKGRRSEIYHTIPVGFAFSKEGNFLLRTLSLGALFRKIKARQQRMPGYFDPWNGDVHLFSKELQDTYLKSTFNGKPGWLGLDPNNPTEETPLAKLKKDRFNDMMNLVNADTRSFNENRMVTPRDTSKRGSKAGDVDNLWRDHRLDAIADLVNTTEATGGYPMDRERIYKNFLPTEAPGTKPVEDTRKEENNPILKALGAITATHVPADQPAPAGREEEELNLEKLGFEAQSEAVNKNDTISQQLEEWANNNKLAGFKTAPTSYVKKADGLKVGVAGTIGIVNGQNSLGTLTGMTCVVPSSNGFSRVFYEYKPDEPIMVETSRGKEPLDKTWVTASDITPLKNQGTSDIRFMPSSKLDEAHAKAIESGDMEEAQRLVDEKAKQKGGILVFHGTTSESGDINVPAGTTVAAHVTTSIEEADYFAGLTKDYLNEDLGKNAEKVIKNWYLFGDVFDPTNKDHIKRAKKAISPYKEIAYDPEDDVYNPEEWQHHAYDFFEKNSEVRNAIKKSGFVGYKDRENPDDSYPWSKSPNIAVFDPNNIKSADPATYDKEGKLIPLSQRFNPESNDIRYLPAKKGVDAGTETDESLPTDERQTANNARAQGAGQQAGGQSQEDRNRLLSGLASVARSSQSSGTEGVQASSGTATRKEVEEAALRKHAEENGIMVDPEPFHKQWQLDGSEAGGEHQVSFPPGPDVVKRTPNPGIQKSTSLAWPLQRALPELDNLRKALSDLKPIVTYH
jgi:uncharacterized protein YdbL (DUF1318 family)